MSLSLRESAFSVYDRYFPRQVHCGKCPWISKKKKKKNMRGALDIKVSCKVSFQGTRANHGAPFDFNAQPQRKSAFPLLVSLVQLP